jgi:hypothetical protein
LLVAVGNFTAALGVHLCLEKPRPVFHTLPQSRHINHALAIYAPYKSPKLPIAANVREMCAVPGAPQMHTITCELVMLSD